MTQLRRAWPETRIVLRGDSGFCRNALMSWCENNDVDFVFGLARNQKLRKIIGAEMQEATQQWKRSGKPARVFSEFSYQTKKTKKGGWDRERRVAAKADQINGNEDPAIAGTSPESEGGGTQGSAERAAGRKGRNGAASVRGRGLDGEGEPG